MALPQNRQERNIISTTVSENLPDFVRQDHPTFVKFVETYYEWLESKENSYFAPLSLNGVVDVDKTSAEFIKYFKTHTMNKFPENFKSVKGDTLQIKKILKRIRSFYLAKGTESSIEFLIRLLFDVYVETYRPAEDIFKSSGGFWYAPTIIRCTDSDPTENAKLRGQPVEFIENDKIIGSAVIDDIHQFVMSGNSILELELVNISDVTLTESSSLKISSDRHESLYSLIIDIPITSPTGLLYTIDDPISVSGTFGSDFKGSVESVDKTGAIRKIRIDEPGLNYSGSHLVSVTTDTGTDASFGSPSYGYIFTKPGVYQNNDGKLSSTEFLQDNFRYQIHSYVIRTEASLSEYESILKDLVHPAGKKVLGDYFVYRKDFGPSADFVGYRNEQLFSPFFANYFPYGIATVNDGAFNASNNGQFGVLDSSIDLRGVCSGFIGSGQYSDAYYDFFPFGYDGATGYTLEFPSSQEQNTNPRTTFGTGISAGWDIQDFNKFGGVGATQEFFARAGQFDIKIQEIQYYNRLAAQNRDHHLLNPFERGDIVAQLNADGSERLRGIVYENSWSQNFGRFKVRILNNPNRNFKTASPSEQEVAFSTSSLLHKIKNITKNAVYTGGSNYTNQLTFFSSNVADGHDQDFFKVGDHIYQGTGASAQGQVLGWNPPVLDILVLTDNDNIDVHGTSFTGGISADCDGASIMRIKGSGHGEPTLSSTTGSTFGGETYTPQVLPTLTAIRFLDSPALSHDTSFFKNGDHIYQGTGGTGLTQAHGYVVSWNPPYLFAFDITPLENWATGISLGVMPSAADALSCDKRLFRVKGSGHGGSTLPVFSGSSFGGEVYTGGTQSFSYTDSSCPLDGGSFALGMFVAGVTKGARMTEGCGTSVPIYRFLKTAGPNVEYQLGGVVDDVTTLVNEDSNTGSTLPGWPSNNTDFWIVHPHPNTWHGNITAGISWGAIPLQSFMKTPYKLTSPPEYGASGSVGGSINQNFNNNIPGGYGS